MSTEIGWRHFAAAEWEPARDAFAAALEADPEDPEALDGLGQSLWWLGRRDEGIERRREAYVAYQRRGDTLGAGRLAVYLAGEHRIDGQQAASAGWLARARRLLASHGATAEAGWLAIEEAKREDDQARSEEHARRALEIAHALADPDVECMALAQLGRAVVHQGRVEEGVAMLDEAMAVALGGETRDPLACGDACCTTLVVCDGLADVQRAAEWCEAVVAFTERRRYTPLQSWCRAIYGGVLVRQGDWARAEEVLATALRRGGDRRRGHGHVLPLATLAELRLRQGRLEEAERLLDGLAAEPIALPQHVRLAIERRELDLAAAHLARLPDGDPETVLLRAELALAEGDAGAAASRARELAEVAAQLTRPDLAAIARLLRGRAAALASDATGAAAELEGAAGTLAELGFPLEAARARLALAAAQHALGSPLALVTARAARDAFERLGARQDADRAAALLRDLGASGRDVTRGERDELTMREREVLGLIAAGLSNGQIAERLVIAPKTAEHHVSRVLAKLGVRSRAEAAAHAVREGL